MGSPTTTIFVMAAKERLMHDQNLPSASALQESIARVDRVRMDADIARFLAVREEINLRARVQSTIVLGTVFIALLLAVLILVLQEFGGTRVGLEIALCFAFADLFGALHWMHNDIRHLQLGTYLAKELEPKLVAEGCGWEAYHHNAPRPTKLGSYWFVGTKGVLTGAPILVLAAALQERSNQDDFGVISMIVLCAVSILLLTRLPRTTPSNSPERKGQ